MKRVDTPTTLFPREATIRKQEFERTLRRHRVATIADAPDLALAERFGFLRGRTIGREGNA